MLNQNQIDENTGEILTSTEAMRKKVDLFFSVPVCRYPEGRTEKSICMGWGYKSTARSLSKRAEQDGLPYFTCEDGFLAYLNHSSCSSILSLCIDKQGIYYDPSKPSDIESKLLSYATDVTFDENKIRRAENVIRLVKDVGASKYNLLDFGLQSKVESQSAKILVVDQVYGDISVGLSGASENTFREMVELALRENPNETVYVKVHPDVILGKKKGYLHDGISGWGRVATLDPSVKWSEVTVSCEKVYTVCSQLGFDALVQGIEVIVFGAPFYAGWGLTRDIGNIPQRRSIAKGKVTLAMVVYAAFVDYCVYRHPETGLRCHVEEVLGYIKLQKPLRFGSLAVAEGFSLWKRAFLPYFLQKHVQLVNFRKKHIHNNSKDDGDVIVCWGATKVESIGKTVLRVEDGFIRSVGLGADLCRPSSLVIDSRGIYFDSSKESDLEFLLNTYAVSDRDLKRAALLKARLVAARVSKYNVGELADLSRVKSDANGRRIILVVGQVDGDASIKLGSPHLKNNLELLEMVRSRNHDAFIVYKPHPDVVSGNRKGLLSAEELEKLVDAVIEDAGIIDTFDAVDEVHTLTSLAGFEALIRGKAVTCYGQPFYSGWSLTTDLYPVARRKVEHTLDSLVYCCLIKYPLYINWDTGLYTTPEYIVDKMSGENASLKKSHPVVGYVQRAIKKIGYLMETFMPKRQRGKNL